MAASIVTSGIITLDFDQATTDPATIDFTVPNDTTAIYFFWCFNTGAANTPAPTSLTIESVSYDEIVAYTTGAANDSCAGVAAWYNPGTGANQTIDVTWGDTPLSGDGPICYIVCTKDGDTTGWRDADADGAAATTATTVTIDSETTDFLLGFNANVELTVPGTPAGWTSEDAHQNNSAEGRLSSRAGLATSTTFDGQDEDYGAVAAVSIKEAITGITIEVPNGPVW